MTGTAWTGTVDTGTRADWHMAGWHMRTLARVERCSREKHMRTPARHKQAGAAQTGAAQTGICAEVRPPANWEMSAPSKGKTQDAQSSDVQARRDMHPGAAYLCTRRPCRCLYLAQDDALETPRHLHVPWSDHGRVSIMRVA